MRPPKKVLKSWLASSWGISLTTIRRWNENDGSVLAASMAYYAAFSIFPLILVLVSALGFALRYSVGAKNSQDQLLKIVSENTAPQLAEQLAAILAEVQTDAPIGGPLGLATLLFGAIGIFSQLDLAFDRVWKSDNCESHGIWGTVLNVLGNRLRAFAALLGLGLLVVVAFFTGIFLSSLRTLSSDLPGASQAWGMIHLGSALLVNSAVFTLLFKAMPKPAVRWRDAVRGGLFVAIVWELGRIALAWFIVGNRYSAYGVVGAFVAVMLWIYYVSNLVLLGAQFVQVLGQRAGARAAIPERPCPPARG